jgi:hypothetical protein
MHKIASSLSEKARKVAEEMIKTGETIMPLLFRTAKNSVFVSTDRDAVFALNLVIVEKQKFFIGQ